jgi:hypothetical protein
MKRVRLDTREEREGKNEKGRIIRLLSSSDDHANTNYKYTI